MAGLKECLAGPLLPEDDGVEEVHWRFAGFREGNCVESCVPCMTRYLSVYERPGVLIQTPPRRSKFNRELSGENAHGLVTRTLFV